MTINGVKAFAQKNHLQPLNKEESQDICFIKNNSVSEFILSKINIKPCKGQIIDIEGKIYNSSMPFPSEPAFEMILRKVLNLKEME